MSVIAYVQPGVPDKYMSIRAERSSAICGYALCGRYHARAARAHVPMTPTACLDDKENVPRDVTGTEQPPEDIVERIFNVFFGKKEKEPFGLKRFDRDRFPELYPATLDEFADPVDGDSEEVALFRPLLARTQLQSRPLQLLYDADVHGWDAESFHACVNRKGATIGIAATEGAVFGYYNPKGHVGYGESRGSIAAFLFTWKDGDTSKRPVKLRKVGKAALACVDDPDSGPKLGADALVVPLRPPRATWSSIPEDRLARSKLGSYYERLSDGPNRSTLFGATEDGKGELLRYLRVYGGIYGPDEEIPFNDALPFSLE